MDGEKSKLAIQTATYNCIAIRQFKNSKGECIMRKMTKTAVTLAAMSAMTVAT